MSEPRQKTGIWTKIGSLLWETSKWVGIIFSQFEQYATKEQIQWFSDQQSKFSQMLAIREQAMQQQQVSAEKLQGVWVDVGTPERLEQLDQQIMQGVFL